MGHRHGRNSAVLFVVALLAAGSSQAQTQTWKEDYRQVVPSSNISAMPGQGAFGEQISLYTGELSFHTTDVSLPGNDGLEVAFHRAMGTSSDNADAWHIDVPRLEGTYPADVGWTRKQIDGTSAPRCSSGKLAPPLASGGNTVGTTSAWDTGEYWSGDFLRLPGSGPEELLKSVAGGAKLPTDGATYVWLTASGWRFSCLPTLQNGSGEGFLGVSPDGVRYYFDWYATQQELELTRPFGTGSMQSPTPSLDATSAPQQPNSPVNDGDYLSRARVMLYVTRVEDRFGNHVDYNYGANGLTSIVASDGRTITVGRDGQGALTSVTANGRIWTYGSSGGVTTVTQPDGAQWLYDLEGLRQPITYFNESPDGSAATVEGQCDNPEATNSGGGTGTVTAPSGATATFHVVPTRHGRSYVPRNCLGYSLPNGRYMGYSLRPYVFDVRSLTSIQVTGPGLASTTWSYAYGPANNAWEADCTSGCTATKYVDVTAPDGTRTRHTFSNRFGLLEGRELTTQVYSAGGALARTTTYTYQTSASGQPYPAQIGLEGNLRGDGAATRFEPELSTTIVQDGRTFPRLITAYDDLARPVALTRGGRAEAIVYSDNLSKWVLGQVAQRTVAGVVAEQTTFTTNAQPWKLYSFGKLQQTLTYDTDGTLQTVTDGNSHTTTLSQWYRGIPKRIDHADNKYQAALVDANGWLTQVTDENGHATVYSHDAMGRLSGITYPTGDSTAWNTTTIAFVPVTSIEYGIPSGHWRQTVSTGNARKVTWFDGLWRALLTREYDTGNIAATDHYSAASYDSLGRAAYTAYPVASAPTSSVGAWTLPGVRTTYDALGRVLTVKQDSEIGTLTTSSQYLSDFRTKVTNPRGKANTTSYLTWDVPTTDYPVTIVHPEGAQTDIARDAFGKPLSITRGEQ